MQLILTKPLAPPPRRLDLLRLVALSLSNCGLEDIHASLLGEALTREAPQARANLKWPLGNASAGGCTTSRTSVDPSRVTNVSTSGTTSGSSSKANCLRRLDLSYNNLTAEGAEPIAKALRSGVVSILLFD